MRGFSSIFKRSEKKQGFHPDVPPPGSPPRSSSPPVDGKHAPPDQFQPPPGPPPAQFQPPPGLPPQQFQPPPGPPPQLQSNNPYAAYYPPPPGPPPAHSQNQSYDAPPSVDYDLPPPAFHQQIYLISPTSNADKDSADSAELFCDRNPVFPPTTIAPQPGLQLNPYRPHNFRGTIWPQHISTSRDCGDSLILSAAPIFAANFPVAISTFSITIRKLGKGRRSEPAVVAIGAVSPPYPEWRLPGWQRHSFGVHSDDGHRYSADSWGGMEFTKPFVVGDNVGFVIRWGGRRADGGIQGTSVEFWRNMRKDKEWRVDEEWDPTMQRWEVGMDGSKDAYAAIGVFGEVEIEVSERVMGFN